MKRVTKTEIREMCRVLGLEVEIHSPGDGVTRYEFFRRDVGRRSLQFCRGSQLAKTYLSGFADGCYVAKEREHVE